MSHPHPSLFPTTLFALILSVFAGPAHATGPELEPPDPLTGLPYVSARAWGIFDGVTGDLLWGEDVATPHAIASVTKVMTLLVALHEIDRDPALATQYATVSANAGGTRGSGARLNAGEQVILGDLLYGLMLPSGNDASVVIAEHLGQHHLGDEELSGLPVAEPDRTEALNRLAYDAFVERMNATARRLGMRNTAFFNTHGLDADGHESTVLDLAILTRTSLAHPKFREIVNTRTWSAEIATPDGSTRTAEWRNTNQLLNIEGYHGVKTGTTRRARACLVSVGTRGEDSLLMVVLGSAGGDARYSDSRNLYRYAWLQRGHKPQD